jgi:hypothetical protein
MTLVVRPKPLTGPKVRTLAYFGSVTTCENIDTDSQGNIYLLLSQQSTDFVLVMLEAATNTVVQLMTFHKGATDKPKTLAVAPNGQHLFMHTSDHRVLHYQAPFRDAKPQQVAQLEQPLYSMFVGDNM